MATARPFAFNTGPQINGTEQLDDLAIGIPTLGFVATGIEWWNGPDEQLGYIVCIPVPAETTHTPVKMTWDPNKLGFGCTLTNGNMTVVTAGIGSSLLGISRIFTKTMFTIQIDIDVNNSYIGLGKSDMDLNVHVGGPDNKSIGFSSNGDLYFGGISINSSLPTWGNSGDIIDFAIDTNSSDIWIRVNGSPWNNNPSASPSTNAGGVTNPLGVVDIYPAATIFNSGGSQASLLDTPVYSVPSGFQFIKNYAKVRFIRSSSLTEQSFVELVNSNFNQSFLTGQLAKTWLNSNGMWTSYGNLPPGMVLYLDAGISNSYPGTGTTWYDLSGNGNHGTFAGNTSFSTHFGGTMLFDGSNSAITFNNPVNIPIGNEPYTISVWFNSNQMPSDRGFVGWGNFGNVNQVNAWRLRDSGVSGFRHYWWGNDLDYQTPMSTGVWYHAVAAYENGSRKLYLNNVKVAEDYPTGHNVPFATNLRIGVTADFLGEWFDGQIAQVVIYKRQATEAEISIMYQSGLTRFNTYLNGMYVNQFASILGNTAAELALTNFITSKGMNDLTFYMGSLLSTSQNRTYMRSFITQLHSLGQNYWSAGFRVFSNVTQASGCIDTNNPGTEASYNIGCSFNGEKFDGFTQEWEFWNNNPYGDFTTFTVDDIQIYNYCQANGMKYDIYLSKCEDYAALVPDSVIATHIVTYHDTVHLVAYISESTYNSNKGLSAARKAQLELLGYAAIAANKVQEFTILWASYGNSGVNMRDWFVSHPTLLAYVGFESEYNAWVSPAKAGLKFMGQKIYAYSGIFDL